MFNFGISIKGGQCLIDDPKKVRVANFGAMMMEGTKSKTPAELEEAIDALGSSIFNVSLGLKGYILKLYISKEL